MNYLANQNSDIFSDKKYWIPAKRKLLFAVFEKSSNWDQKKLAKKSNKTEHTVERYLKEPTFRQGIAKMAELKRIQLLIQILKFREERWKFLTKEIMKRIDKLSFKNIAKIIEVIEKNHFLSYKLK